MDVGERKVFRRKPWSKTGADMRSIFTNEVYELRPNDEVGLGASAFASPIINDRGSTIDFTTPPFKLKNPTKNDQEFLDAEEEREAKWSSKTVYLIPTSISKVKASILDRMMKKIGPSMVILHCLEFVDIMIF